MLMQCRQRRELHCRRPEPVPALALRLQAPSSLIDITHIPELRGVELQGRLAAYRRADPPLRGA